MPVLHKTKSAGLLYLVLAVWALFSASYNIPGTIALREEFFAADRYTRDPFYLGNDGKTVTFLWPETKNAGLAAGDLLLE